MHEGDDDGELIRSTLQSLNVPVQLHAGLTRQLGCGGILRPKFSLVMAGTRKTRREIQMPLAEASATRQT